MECLPSANAVSFTLDGATIGYSNLGGFGPDFGSPPTVLYNSVGQFEGRSIDLVVSNSSAYVPRTASQNGMSGRFGIINLEPAHSVFLRFSFVDAEYGTPVNFESIYFSVFDLDEGGFDDAIGRTGQERIWTTDASSYVRAYDAELETSAADGSLYFSSTSPGNNRDNPVDPSALTELQTRRSVLFKFTGMSYFHIGFS
eukprot:5272659-Prymnesium_polylepis.2